MKKNSRVIEGKAGAIIIGRRSRKWLPGVFFVGEAGLFQAPLLGTAFDQTLEHAGRICKGISDSIVGTSQGWPKKRAVNFPLIKRVQDRFQLVLARQLLRGNIESLDRLVRAASTLSNKAAFALCSNDLTSIQLATMALKIIRAQLVGIGNGNLSMIQQCSNKESSQVND